MKPKHIFLHFVISVLCVLAYGCFELAMVLRPVGDRGAIYDTWETTNGTFKVRIDAVREENIFMPGGFLIYKSAPAGSDNWREFKSIRNDDAPSIHRERFGFVSERIAYFYMADDFVVTIDGGRTWKVWQPLLPLPDGKLAFCAFREARIEPDGTGRATLARYDEEVKAEVLIEIRTEDFGQSWRIV